ncbi:MULTISPECIES: NUDIX domain-containing protein [Haloarcula]|uniref:NUDIX domain-containing protein n=1 Tax=Haloarcula TaxID=2237 RepID=UPI0023E7E7A6|nr:NUDIX domain-containing protein [Halomicroarcula sp. SHR3]
MTSGEETANSGPVDPGYISNGDWETVVRSVPIVSVDLVVLTDDGVVLTKRTNEPASGEWFVPGGRVRKGERLEAAVHRVAETELGIDVTIERSLGAYEHLYETSELGDAGGKHYVPHGFVVRTVGESFTLDSQHEAVDVFADPPADLHEYVEAYLHDAGVY